MSLTDVLKAVGFTSALIVDDAFDDVPVAADIADQDAWSIFFADIGGEIEKVEAVFPDYRSRGANDLRESDEFVRLMFGLKGTLREDLWNALFESYERARTSDRVFLEDLAKRLSDAGLKVTKAGRTIPEKARESQLIFADLFLGAAQQDFDVDESIKRLTQLVAGRERNPPAVVLMSRSPRLQDKKERFRDDAKMVGALFRVYRKQDLLEGSTVETVVERLATHYADAVRVAAFLAAWETGLAAAAAEFVRRVRRLDLSDYCQIGEVLLDAEGQPLGSYMLDMFDRVLQHELEGDNSTIAAALGLNDIDTAKYPAPYIAGSPDLQDLVARALWQHPDRMKVPGNTAGMPVSFGDILVRHSRLDPTPVEAPPEDRPDVLIVLTPACDLIRNPERRRVLLAGGALKPLDSKTWRYKMKGVGTPIIQLPDQARMWIEWNLDDLRMLTKDELTSLTASTGPYSAKLRLRESNTLDLQQRLLSHMGRVGVMSTMPFTFPVDVTVFAADVDGQPKQISLPTTSSEGGVCITGRDAKGDDLTRLILTEGSVDEILNAISKLTQDGTHNRTKDALRRLQGSTSFKSSLQRGLKAPSSKEKEKLLPLRVDASQPAGTEDEKNSEVVGLIGRDLPANWSLSANNQKDAAIVLVLTDLEQGGDPAKAG